MIAKPPTGEMSALQDLIEHDKRAALATFDAESFAMRVRQQMARGDRSLSGRPSVHSRRYYSAEWQCCRRQRRWYATVMTRSARTDPQVFASVLRTSTFYTVPHLDAPTAVVARQVDPTPEQAFAWSMQAVMLRAQRSTNPYATGMLEQTIATALAGPAPESPVVWPDVDGPELARRIKAMERNHVLTRALSLGR